MKLKYEFSVREIMDEYILVPVGESALEFSGMVTTTEVGAFLCGLLREETTRDALLAALLAEYEVDEATAGADLDEFLAAMGQADLLEE